MRSCWRWAIDLWKGVMSSYAFWNNKGGVGKSFLCFICACEYAFRHPEADVYLIDLCPHANLSETLLAEQSTRAKVIRSFLEATPRSSVAGYIEARLSSPFKPLADVSPFLTSPNKTNSAIPKNLKLVCGDNLLEILSEAIRQTSQLSIPTDAWRQVICWIKDLVLKLREIAENETRCSLSIAIRASRYIRNLHSPLPILLWFHSQQMIVLGAPSKMLQRCSTGSGMPTLRPMPKSVSISGRRRKEWSLQSFILLLAIGRLFMKASLESRSAKSHGWSPSLPSDESVTRAINFYKSELEQNHGIKEQIFCRS